MPTDVEAIASVMLTMKRHRDNKVYVCVVGPKNKPGHPIAYWTPNPIQKIHPSRIVNHLIEQQFLLYEFDHILKHNIDPERYFDALIVFLPVSYVSHDQLVNGSKSYQIHCQYPTLI